MFFISIGLAGVGVYISYYILRLYDFLLDFNEFSLKLLKNQITQTNAKRECY